MAVKYLDLDAVNIPKGRVKIKGDEYDVYSMSLQSMINLAVLQKEAEEKGDDNDDAETLTHTIEIMQEIFPTCPRETLNSLTMEQLQALIDFSNSMNDEEVEKNSTAPKRRKKPQ